MASTSSIDDLESQIPTILRSNKDYFQFFVMTLQLSISHPDGQYSILERRCSMAKRVGTSDHYKISAISKISKFGKSVQFPGASKLVFVVLVLVHQEIPQ